MPSMVHALYAITNAVNAQAFPTTALVALQIESILYRCAFVL